MSAPSTTPVRVLVLAAAPDGPLLAGLLAAAAPPLAATCIPAGPAGLRHLLVDPPDACLAVTGPDRPAADLIAAARATGYGGPILLVGPPVPAPTVEAAIAAGAADYLDRSRLDGPALAHAVHAARARAAAEARVRADDRLRAVGRVASGIAHEFNNALAGIVGRLDLLALALPDPAQQATLASVQEAADAGAMLVQRVQDFARLHPPGPSAPAPVTELVTGAVVLTQPRWQAGKPDQPRIALLTEVEHGLTVDGDATALREALMNLILNAVDALPAGGRISVLAEQVGLEVVLRVQDTGIGMDPAVQAQMFEPFFTTKVTGIGLGLSIVADVAARHGGYVTVETAPDRGTTVALHLPARAGDVLPSRNGGAAAPAAPLPAPPDLARLAHDMRSPLTYLVGYAELLATRDLPAAQVRAMAAEVLDQAMRLNSLLDRLRGPGSRPPPGNGPA